MRREGRNYMRNVDTVSSKGTFYEGMIPESKKYERGARFMRLTRHEVTLYERRVHEGSGPYRREEIGV